MAAVSNMVKVCNMAEAFGVIDSISKLSGNAAIERLAEYGNDPLLREILWYAYNPFLQFGIKKMPEPKYAETDSGFHRMEWSAYKQLLNDLSSRRTTGENARDQVAVAFGLATTGQQELFKRILKKDLRFGLSASKINKAIPSLIPVFQPMLAKPYDPKRIKSWPVGVEEKLDGVRVFAIYNIDTRKVRFVSRTGKPFTSFDHLAEAVGHLYGVAEAFLGERLGNDCCVIDGEITSGSFLDTVSSARRKEQSADGAVFHVFDILTDREFFDFGMSFADYNERRSELNQIAARIDDVPGIEIIDVTYATSQEELDTMVADVWDRGGEGVIVKPLDGRYECKRSFQWLKVKAEASEDLVVTGAFEGTGKYEGLLGGFIVRRYHNGEPVDVRVGGGFSDDQRDEFWNAYFADLEADVMPLDESGNVLGRVIEVEYHEVTPDGSLRHPRFKRFRDSLTGEKE